MINPFQEVNWRPGSSELRRFGVTLVIGFTIISATLLAIRCAVMPMAEAVGIVAWIFAFGFGLGLLAILLPPLAWPFYLLWYFLSCSLGMVISNLCFLLFFYALFSPFALLLRLLTGRDPLVLKKLENRESYWCRRPPGRSTQSYLRQY
ncbi:MAG: hypothetical protein KJ630_09605 [Proteobacteria bacterium]|nr:hypothetical protein [Pseudomonadota bacterium]